MCPLPLAFSFDRINRIHRIFRILSKNSQTIKLQCKFGSRGKGVKLQKPAQWAVVKLQKPA